MKKALVILERSHAEDELPVGAVPCEWRLETIPRMAVDAIGFRQEHVAHRVRSIGPETDAERRQRISAGPGFGKYAQRCEWYPGVMAHSHGCGSRERATEGFTRERTARKI